MTGVLPAAASSDRCRSDRTLQISFIPAQMRHRPRAGCQSQEAARTRAERRTYLAERGYNVCEVRAEDVEKDVAGVLVNLATAISLDPSS